MDTNNQCSDDVMVEKVIADASLLYDEYLKLSRVTDVVAVLNAPIQSTKTWGAPLTFVMQKER